jgi:hypothetical protein
MKPKNEPPPPFEPGGAQQPKHDTLAEQTREREESRAAHEAESSNRKRMVEIGRGNQQAGRQGS